jgi:hypothetical protein
MRKVDRQGVARYDEGQRKRIWGTSDLYPVNVIGR